VLAFSVPPLRLEISDGDITAEATDAVVNAANNHFWMGAGVAGALKARGGPSIETEAMALGPVDVGECVITSGGRLAARHVIHAAVMGQDLQTSAEIIARATRNVLRIAGERSLVSVSLPAFGTGVGGFDVRESARVMINEIRDRAATAQSLRRLRLVLFGQRAYREAAETACEMLGQPLDGPADCPISS